MAGSRWADDAEAKALEAQRKKEKEEKKRLKLEKQRQQEEEARRASEEANRPQKRRRISLGPQDDATPASKESEAPELLKLEGGSWGPCRNVSNYETLNAIEEGTYGWVSRAKDVSTGEVVALKKLKMDFAYEGFPVTALREIQLLRESHHPNIVSLKEVVMGASLSDVYMVMEFMEHDLKTLQDDKLEPFLQSEVKTLLLQIASAVHFLHDHWILHRDLKTSNILLDNRGLIKIADFGMARRTSSPPPPNLTQLVVTLWYRSPELLLGTPTYDTSVDTWSLGCIFGELLLKEPLLQGKNEVDQLSRIFELCGIPTNDTWPGFKRLPNAKSLRLPSNADSRAHGSIVRAKFPFLTSAGADLLSSLLSLNPENRPSAKDMLNHPYFKEKPKPISTALFPTFPSKAGQERRRRIEPHAPQRGEAPRVSMAEVDFSGIFAGREEEQRGAGFSLRMG
ncbi:Pkinase-domain-containing protein [Delitschia confertaspora ATCC 74209]|uniref:cyclin-dependent kinase n=1 Tax=Delitschia confertaspora ATCC 74209 TaxID=1513339 RepID=A0A9P4JPM0_9PLEO|nr:Pkinase-domain-containing protein [Delitschia confertaspora ATCC 74209]